MRTGDSSKEPIIIVGGGVIGLSIAWQLARAGESVIVIDRETAGRQASWVAAGMLAPHTEVGFEDEAFLHLGVDSLHRYPSFLQELAADSGRRITLDDRGALMVALDRDDNERLRRLYTFQRNIGLPVKWLSAGEARRAEPALSPRTTAALALAEDTQINNRALLEALKIAFVKTGGTLKEQMAVTAIDCLGGRAIGVKTDTETIAGAAVIIAAGCWSRQIEGVPIDILPPVRPIKGQLVSLRAPKTQVLQTIIRGSDVYVMPKDDGRVVVGATQEEMGFDTTPTAGPVMRLLQRGWETIPSIYDLPIESIDVGLRPGSRDNIPIIGATSVTDLYYATGHFRHGILLAPVTAYGIRDLLLSGKKAPALQAADPRRFAQRAHISTSPNSSTNKDIVGKTTRT